MVAGTAIVGSSVSKAKGPIPFCSRVVAKDGRSVTTELSERPRPRLDFWTGGKSCNVSSC